MALIGESSRRNHSLKIRFEDLVAKVTDAGITTGLVALTTRTYSTASLAEIRVPTLILVGEEDKVTPVSESEILAKAIVGSQLKILKNIGHLSNLEDPQQLNDHISEFLHSLN